MSETEPLMLISTGLGSARCRTLLPGSFTVKDDGEGFDAAEAFSEEHFGLRGMRERIHRFDGKFEIESAPRQGTRVRIKIPRAAIAS